MPMPSPIFKVNACLAAGLALTSSLLPSSSARADFSPLQPAQQDELQRNLQSYISLEQNGAQTPLDRPIDASSVDWLNAIELVQDQTGTPISIKTFFTADEISQWPLASQVRAIRMQVLSGAEFAPLEQSLQEQLKQALKRHQLGSATIGEMNNLRASGVRSGDASWERIFSEFRLQYPKETALFDRLSGTQPVLTSQAVYDLFWVKPTINLYDNGAYDDKPRLFLFCRQNRNYPCLRVMKDQNDNPVRNADGSLWSLPGLALSQFGKPYNVSDGNTPQGVHLVDGVIQDGSDPMGFGKFSRIVLDFVPESPNEANTMLLLPESSQDLDWWQEAVVARNVGRGLLRLHGTGEINTDPSSLYYPLTPTDGCVSSRENTYGQTTYTDQLELLDTWQESEGLAPSTANETKIGGLLYVINLDDQTAPVSLSDLASYGIK